jgi:hypothetical protein
MDGFAISRKTAWIGHIEEEPKYEIQQWFFWTTRIIKENAKYFFKFGDAKQEFTTTCNTKEEALEEWERVLCLINESSKKE